MDEAIWTEVAQRIKHKYNRAKVYLFGSMAKRADTADSDVDLCVVIEKPNKRLLEISRSIRKEIFPLIHRPLDILVYDRDTFNERSSFPLTMEAAIAEQAREL